MFSFIIALLIYTVLVLFFVPLKTIAKYQGRVQTTIRDWIKKLND